MRLPFDAVENTVVSETIHRIWQHLQPHVVGVYPTMTAWATKGPRKTVRELVKAGRSADEIVAKWEELKTELGPVVRLEIVQKAFLTPLRKAGAPPPLRGMTAGEIDALEG